MDTTILPGIVSVNLVSLHNENDLEPLSMTWTFCPTLQTTGGVLEYQSL